VLLLTASLVISGGIYFIYGEKLVMACFPWYGQFAPLVMKANIYAGEMSQYIPSFMIPSDTAAIQAWQNGGIFEWAAWMPSTLYWCIWSLIYLMCSYFWMFFMLKPLIRDERLPFPHGMPTVWTTDQFAKSEGKTKIFDWKLTSTKSFYVFFAVGALMIFPDIVRFWIPGVINFSELRLHQFDLTPYTQSILPGAFTNMAFDTGLVGASFLMPLDILGSIMLLYLIFYVAYPVMSVKLGWNPYTAGVPESNAGFYANNVGVFRVGLFVTYGVGAGLALIYIYRYRKHFIDVFKATFGNKSVSQEEDGLSYRFIGIGAIGVTLLMLIFELASGVPFGPAITIIFWWIVANWIFMLLTSVMYENAAWYTPLNYDSAIWDIGHLTAGWPAVPPGLSVSSASTFILSTSMVPGNFTGGYSPKNLIYAFKLGDTTKTKWKEIFYTIIITTVVLVIVQHIIYVPWTTQFGGLTGQNSISYYYWAIVESNGMTVSGSPLFAYVDPVTQYSYTATGIIAAILLTLARQQWSWFYFNPLALFFCSYATSVSFAFLSYVAAFVIKLALLKLGGSKLHDEVGMPAAVGYCMGYGSMAFVMNLIYFFLTPGPTLLGKI